jgi:hypothetical protein
MIPKIRPFIISSLILLLGCGTSGDPFELTVTPPDGSDPITVRGDKEGINVIVAGSRKVRYLGEIVNNGEQKSCFIDIIFTTKDADGNQIDTQDGISGMVNGFTLTNFGDEVHSCLKPGEFGSFDTGDWDLTGEFADFDFRICFRRNGVCQSFPLAQEPRVPMVISDLIPGEVSGMRTYRVQIKNDADPLTAPNSTAFDVTVFFTVFNNEGKIIGTASSGVLTAQPCGNIPAQNPSGCIGPGIIANAVTVNTNVPVSEICAGCFYARIYHSE